LRRRFRCYRFLESRASMGAQVRLRCSARLGTPHDTPHLYCDRYHWHTSRHEAASKDGRITWDDADCENNADSTGRETAALRILEVAHEIDRLNFMRGFATDDEVRAIASRLMFNGNRAASSDLAQLEWRSANTADRDCVKLLDAAADILRPFARQ